VYALVLFRLFLLIPTPDHTEWHWGFFVDFFGDHAMTFVLVVIGLAVTIIYWGQSNMLLGSLQKTDGCHTALAIVQIFCLLLFILALKISIDLGASPGTRALESAAAALVGIAAGWGWSYAIKDRRLLHADVSDEDALEMRDRILAEPITALVTIPFAFIGPWLWEAAWLTYPLTIKVLKRRRRSRPAS
jgi:uncharacterized membrane protein